MRHVIRFIWLLTFVLMSVMSYGQEFPIATGDDHTIGGGGDFDGTNFLFAILGDPLSSHGINAQFVSPAGTLVGPRISLGTIGSNPLVAFDGTNFLIVWTDSFPSFAGGDVNGIGNIYGQFISTSGTLVGSSFTIVTGANSKFGQGRGGIAFQDTTYLLTFMKGGHHTDYLYGQRISRSGQLIGLPFQISSHYARESAVAFDGTNYLVAWCRVAHPDVDRDIYGQFVSRTGALVGANFLIDDSPNASDNPTTMTFDGSRYCLAFHDLAADTTGRWNLYARFVSTSGAVAERFMICDSTKAPTFASAAFDGTNYLITWIETVGPIRVRGRYYTPTGIPIDAAFTAFDTLGGKYPIGGVGGFANGRFILSATRLDGIFSNGDIYGMFLEPLTAGAAEESGTGTPETFALSQNFPNPFNPSTTIRYALPHRAHVTLTVFSPIGQKVAELLDGVVEAGRHELQFNAGNLSSGVYFYRLQARPLSVPVSGNDGRGAGNFVETKSLLLLR